MARNSDPGTPAARPAVSVIVPFSGSQARADEVCARLSSLALSDRDELILVDNSPAALREPRPPVRRLRAIGERSSYHARNAGTAAAANEWVLFMDSDCRPRAADLLDRLFARPIDSRCGAVAGAIVDVAEREGLLAEHARTRRYLDQTRPLSSQPPFALTANLMVRRAAWAAVGGFCEGIRSGGDRDFCWRLQEAGWSLGYSETAAVDHIHPDRLRPALRKFVRYGAGAAWLSRRHPSLGSTRPPLVAGLGRAIAGALVWTLTLKPRRAALKLLDGLVIIAMNIGYLHDNRPPRLRDSPE
ncbi:MAG TPA: glycosyltransferase family 2 protein [Solirubrobacteraceae bacterium]